MNRSVENHMNKSVGNDLSRSVVERVLEAVRVQYFSNHRFIFSSMEAFPANFYMSRMRCRFIQYVFSVAVAIAWSATPLLIRPRLASRPSTHRQASYRPKVERVMTTQYWRPYCFSNVLAIAL